MRAIEEALREAMADTYPDAVFADDASPEPCPYCGEPMVTSTRDHIIPSWAVTRVFGAALGGKNILACCATCNGAKGRMLPSEIRKRGERLLKVADGVAAALQDRDLADVAALIERKVGRGG